MNFVPLYVRSEYSMLQSTCSIEKLVITAKEYGYQALAIADEGVMYGALKFYNACLKVGIKPIIGLRIPYNLNGKINYILLYAMDILGYRNLMKISSRYQINHVPLDVEELRRYSMGVLAVVSFDDLLKGLLKNGNDQELLQHLTTLETIYYSYLYIGITVTTLSDKKNLQQYCNALSKYKVKMVGIIPTFYLNPSDLEAYQVLKSIANNGNLANITEMETNCYLYLKQEAEFLFKDVSELILSSSEIASLCNLTIEFNQRQLPKFDAKIDAEKYLYELGIKGLKKRLSRMHNPDFSIYLNRFKYEYEIIVKMGFADYFLIVWDYVKYAKQHSIYVGPGRGSAGASLIAFCLGITDIDPIKHQLLFERFLNPERVTMPDIDIDFPDNQRDLVIEYVGKKYGRGMVAHIVTFGTYQMKLAINDVSRVLKLDEVHLKQLMKQINNELKNERYYNMSLENLVNSSKVLIQLLDEYEDIAKVVSIACKIQGLPRNTSTHAAGIVITKYNLVNYTPLSLGLNGIYQTQYEASDLESLGLLKMDFLGLKNLTNIAKTIDMIKQDNPSFILPSEEDDPKVFKMLANGDVVGVFQLESAGMRKVIMQLKTKTLDDVIAALALYRPGPMEIIPTFIARKFRLEQVTYPHIDLEEILKETYGTIVYQEQIMQIAVKFAGYSLGRADILRRAVSKKKKEVLEKERESFIEASRKQGYSETVAEDIYNYIVKFADYGFNKAHSVAYAKLAYQTAYLKCYYPTYYLSTLMTSFMGSASDILSYCKEAMRKKIQIYPPMINHSVSEFIPYNSGILLPLSIIKGVGEVKTNELIKERLKKKFTSFKDFIIRTKDIIPLSIVNNIIFSGALDEFKLTKKAMIDTAKLHIDYLDYEGIPGMIQITYSEEEYQYGYLIEKEKEVLGINLIYNFFIQYASLYQNHKLLYIKDAKENMPIRTLGIITKIRVIKTKKNDLMAFATLEDNEDSIELTLFPSVYARFSQINDNSIVIIEGNVTMRNNLQIIVNDIKMV